MNYQVVIWHYSNIYRLFKHHLKVDTRKFTMLHCMQFINGKELYSYLVYLEPCALGLEAFQTGFYLEKRLLRPTI